MDVAPISQSVENVDKHESSGRKDSYRRSRGDWDTSEQDNKRMRHASPSRAHRSEDELVNKTYHTNGEAAKRKHSNDGRRDLDSKQHGQDESGRVAKHSDAENERRRYKRQSRSPEPSRRRNRSRSRSPARRNSSMSPRRHRSRSRSKSPVVREHKRGDPRANAARNRQICIDYSRGRCSRESSCKYIHEDPEGKLNSRRSRDPRERKDNPHHTETRRSFNIKHKEDEGHHQQDPAPFIMTTDNHDNGQQQGDWPDPPTLQYPNQWQQPYGDLPPSATTYMQNNGSQPWLSTSLQNLQEQNTQFQIPLPPPAFNAPFGNFEQMPTQAAPILKPEELVMEAVSPDMPGHARDQTYESTYMQQVVPSEPYIQQQQQQQKQQERETDASARAPENVSVTEAAPEEPGGSDEEPEGEAEAEPADKKRSKKDNKASMLVRIAVTEYVKEVLKPTWKEGHMSKDVYKMIAKKAVDKVVNTLQGNQIPKTPEKVDHFMEFSRQKISKLVQGYVEKYSKSSSS